MFFCGMSNNSAELKKTTDEQREHLQQIISLKQDPRARLFLQVNVVLICIVAVFLFIFFSIPDGGPTAPTIPYGKMYIGNNTL